MISVQLGCPNYQTCHASALLLGSQKTELAALKDKVERADAVALELQAAMSMRMVSVEIQKRDERIAANQKNETVLQRSVDRLEQENAMLRQIMRTNKFDMDAVAEILSNIKTPASMLEPSEVTAALFG